AIDPDFAACGGEPDACCGQVRIELDLSVERRHHLFGRLAANDSAAFESGGEPWVRRGASEGKALTRGVRELQLELSTRSGGEGKQPFQLRVQRDLVIESL